MATTNGGAPSGPEREPTLTEILRRAEAAPEPPKPPPDLLAETSRLTGDSIRAAVNHVTAHILALVVDAEEQVAKLRIEAEDFAESLTDIGNAHAARIEEALGHLASTVDAIRRERDRVAAISQPRPAATAST